MGARTRFFARSHLKRMAREAHDQFPQVACLSFDAISMCVMVDGRYELEELRALEREVFPHLPSRTTCLDIGSNIGNHALFFAEHFEQVLAFEPHPRLYPLLNYNAGLTDNIRTFPFGLSDSSTTVQASAAPGNIGATRIGSESGNSFDFKVKRLDDLPEVQSLDRIDFVKIDVEGHEPQMLKGAEAILRRHRPVIAIEVLKAEVKQGTSASLDALRSFGYRAFYELSSNRPFAFAPKPLAKAATFLIGLIFNHRPEKRFSLVPLESLSSSRNYPMILAFADPIAPRESD